LLSAAGSDSLLTLTSAAAEGLEVFGSRLLLGMPEVVQSISLPPTAGSPVIAVAASASFFEFVPCGTDACWVDTYGTITRMTPSGDLTTTVVPIDAPYQLLEVVSDGASFYRLMVDNLQTRRLERIALDGASAPFVVSTSAIWSIAMDDDCVYWSTEQGIFSVAKTAQGPFSQ
jgi:hypothetical protein